MPSRLTPLQQGLAVIAAGDIVAATVAIAIVSNGAVLAGAACGLVIALAALMAGGLIINRAANGVGMVDAKLRSVFDAAEDAIFIKDTRRRYVHVNGAMERLTGKPAGALIGRCDDEIVPPRRNDETIGMDDRVLAGERLEADQSVVLDGRRRHLHAIKVPIRNSKGAIVGLCGIARDLTGRVREAALVDARREVLARIVAGRPEADVLSCLCAGFESQFPDGSACSVFLVGKDGKTIRRAEPSDDAVTVEESCPRCCAHAIRTRKPVFEPNCWCVPFYTESGRALGAIRTTLASDRKPTPDDQAILESAGLLASIIVERTRARDALSAGERRFREFADRVDDVIWFASPEPPSQVLYASPAFERLTGVPVSTLYENPCTLDALVHPDDRARIGGLYDEWLADLDGPAFDHQYRIVRPDGEIRWIHDRCAVLRDANGAIDRVAGILTDTTLTHQAEERQARMMRELDHRVRNNLAAIVGLMEETLRASDSLEDFRDAFTGRVQAVCKTHDAIVAGDWLGVDLEHLVHMAIKPYDRHNGASRFTIRGGPLTLPPADCGPVCMLLHELVTNAGKHGSLLKPEGRVDVEWRVRDGCLVMTWREHDGPTVTPPTETGTGMSLMRALVEHELAGTIDFAFEPGGCCCTLTLPTKDSHHADAPHVVLPDSRSTQHAG